MSTLVPIARADRRRLRLAVLVTGIFMLSTLVQGATRPGYDAWHQSISALSLGTGGWVQELSFFVLGLALLTTVPVWRRVLKGGIGEQAYPVLTALSGLSLVAAAVLPQDPAPGYDPERLGLALPTTVGLLHLSAAAVGAIGSIAGLFVMGRRFRTAPEWTHWATFSSAAGVLTIFGVVVYAVWSVQPSGFAGTFERLVVVVPGLWGFAVVSRLSRGTPFVIGTSAPNSPST